MHEIGHALGMSHPGAYDAAPDTEITYAQHAEYYQDSYEYTIMSYFGSSNTGAVRTGFAADAAGPRHRGDPEPVRRQPDDADRRHRLRLQQHCRPAGLQFRAQRQSRGRDLGRGRSDMLDFSGWSSNSRIDLAAGAFSDGGGQTSNVQIAFGTTIEKAVGRQPAMTA